jgi:hypothetical protein
VGALPTTSPLLPPFAPAKQLLAASPLQQPIATQVLAPTATSLAGVLLHSQEPPPSDSTTPVYSNEEDEEDPELMEEKKALDALKAQLFSEQQAAEQLKVLTRALSASEWADLLSKHEQKKVIEYIINQALAKY